MADLVTSLKIKQSNGEYTKQDIGVEFKNVLGLDNVLVVTESSEVATHDYDIGDQFLWEGELYEAVIPIGIGDIFDKNSEKANIKISNRINEVFKGASPEEKGSKGMVPAPEKNEQDKFLCANGKWKEVPNPDVMVGADSDHDGNGGLVPTPVANDNNKVLFGSGAWENIIDYRDYARKINNVVEITNGIPNAIIYQGELVYITIDLDEYLKAGLYLYTGSVDIVPPMSVKNISSIYFQKIDETKVKVFGEKDYGSRGLALMPGLVPPLAYSHKNEELVLQSNGWGHKLQADILYDNGQYGYYDKDKRKFIPFKSQDDVDSAVASAKVGTATVNDVLEGKTFTNSNGSGLVGKIPQYSIKESLTLHPFERYIIHKGYYDKDTSIIADMSDANFNIVAGKADSSSISYVPTGAYQYFLAMRMGDADLGTTKDISLTNGARIRKSGSSQSGKFYLLWAFVDNVSPALGFTVNMGKVISGNSSILLFRIE